VQHVRFTAVHNVQVCDAFPFSKYVPKFQRPLLPTRAPNNTNIEVGHFSGIITYRTNYTLSHHRVQWMSRT